MALRGVGWAFGSCGQWGGVSAQGLREAGARKGFDVGVRSKAHPLLDVEEGAEVAGRAPAYSADLAPGKGRRRGRN